MKLVRALDLPVIHYSKMDNNKISDLAINLMNTQKNISDLI